MREIENENRRAAVLMLDLDGFKAINDVHGHLVGDKALIEFSERIGKTAKGALVARVGGDEFATVLPKIGSLDEPAALARRIIVAVSKSFRSQPPSTALGVGIGISIAPDDGIYRRRPVRRGDLALYRAKAEGRSSTRFFEPAVDAHVERRTGDRARIARRYRLATRSRRTISRWSASTATASSASRRWRAGKARCSATCRPTPSSPSPRKAA